MDILFDARYNDLYGSVSQTPLFSISFDPEAMALQCIGDMAVFTVQAFLKRDETTWSRPPFKDSYPIILALHGLLYGQAFYRGNQGIGAHLVLAENFPLSLRNGQSQLLNLAFHCSRSYLQCIEEQRAENQSANPQSPFTLGISFRGTISPLPGSLVATQSKAPNSQPVSIPVQSRNDGETVRISRSHWADMLSSIGYPQRRSIELPVLKPQEGAEELFAAIEQVNTANTLFAQDRYREAVQRCRQARDALLGVNKKTWWQTYLAPRIGSEKALMIDEGIKALNHMGHESSHVDPNAPPVEIDRETASYIIGTLTLILDYIGRKIR